MKMKQLLLPEQCRSPTILPKCFRSQHFLTDHSFLFVEIPFQSVHQNKLFPVITYVVTAANNLTSHRQKLHPVVLPHDWFPVEELKMTALSLTWLRSAATGDLRLNPDHFTMARVC